MMEKQCYFCIHDFFDYFFFNLYFRMRNPSGKCSLREIEGEL